MQIYTLLQTNDINYLRKADIDLAQASFNILKPTEAIKIKDNDYDPFMLGPTKSIPFDHTVWDKIIINGPLTFNELFDFLGKEYGIKVDIVSCSGIHLIQTFQKSSAKK